MADTQKPGPQKRPVQRGQTQASSASQRRAAKPGPQKQEDGPAVSISRSPAADFIELWPSLPATGLRLLESFFDWKNDMPGLASLDTHFLESEWEDWSGDSSLWSQEKKLRSLDPELRPKVQNILDSLRGSGFQPKIFFGWRSVAVQEELFKKGNTKVHFSFHNSQLPDGTPNAHAADIVDERWGWDAAAEKNGFWEALGKAAKEQGLVWGGDWKSFPDVAHVQNRENSELAAVKKESGL